MNRVGRLSVCLLLWASTAALSGCSTDSLTETATPARTDAALTVVPGGTTIGQSFVARHAGLQGVDVYLAADGLSGTGRLTLHVRRSALTEADLRGSQISLQLPASPGWYHFAFSPMFESHGQPYYFFVEGTSAWKSTGVPAASYQDGALYLNHRPQDGQLAFRLEYGAWPIMVDLAVWLGQTFRILIVMVALFILPGLALQSYLLPCDSWKERLALSAGLSLSVYPLILLWTRAVGLQPGAATVWLPVFLALLALGWRMLRPRLNASQETRFLAMHSRTIMEWGPFGENGFLTRSRNVKLNRSSILADATWIIVISLVLFVRLFVLRSVDAPMWGDSVQHAVIGQLIVDQGGLFDSWLPYAPYESLTVHYGFHSLIAAIMWLSGEPILTATLLAGQVVNFFAILTLSLLAARLVNNPWAGVGVTLVAGLLSPLPNVYIDWGRYSQLMGQAIMPVAVWLVWRLFERDHPKHWPTALLAAISVAGSFLAYYRMPHYIVAFLLALAPIYLASQWRHLTRNGLQSILAVAGSGLAGALLILPWLIRIRGGALAESVEIGVTQGSTWDSMLREYDVFSMMDQYLPLMLVWLAAVVCVWALVRRRPAVIMMALWAIAIGLLPMLRMLRVPGANSLQGFAILISLYMPISLLVGYGIDAALGWLAPHGRVPLVIALAALSVVALMGTRERLGVIDSAYRILAPADLKAMQWIRNHVTPDALFLVDGFLIYDGQSVVGSDGGWWIPLLTGRMNTMPPQYPLLSERPLNPSYNQFVVNLVAQLRKVGVTSREGVALLCQSKITHAYVGQGQGRIGLPPPEPMLSIAALEKSPAFTPIYRQDKVGVFALNESACR